jgi:two-component system, cell cycle response regulator
METRPVVRYAWWALRAGAALTVAFAVQSAVRVGGDWVDGLFTVVIYNVVLVLATVVIVVRGLAVRRERGAWLLLGGALVLWTVADIYFSLFVQDLDPIPIPSVADGLWLGFYPPAYAALVLLVRSRLWGLRRGMWLDGVIGAFAVAALCAAVVVQPVVSSGLGGSVWQVATTLAYPLADLILLSVTTLILALNGWRLEPTWRLLGAGFLVFAVADAVYFWQTSHGTYEAGGPVDVGWLLMALLCAAAALQPSPARRESTSDGQRALVVPTAFGLAGLGLLVYGNLASISGPALALATLCTLSVIARMGLTFAQSRHESLTDSLTGLPNRRALARDLRERAPHARRERPLGLGLFDLNGFKLYNDRFGHPAGDALLIRLSHRLQAALAGHGIAYRMGGDEFCVLVTPSAVSLEELIARCLAALGERGDGFAIDAAHGLVSLPDDVTGAEDALRVADQRMYALKHGGRVPAERQTTDALLALLAERHPDIGDHADGVAELAGAPAVSSV